MDSFGNKERSDDCDSDYSKAMSESIKNKNEENSSDDSEFSDTIHKISNEVQSQEKKQNYYLQLTNDALDKNRNLQDHMKKILASINLSLNNNMKAQNVNKALLRNRKEFHREARPRKASILTSGANPYSSRSLVQASFWNKDESSPDLTEESKMLLTLKKFMPVSYKFSYIWLADENRKLCLAILSLAQKRINEKLIKALENNSLIQSLTTNDIKNAMSQIRNYTIESEEIVKESQNFDATDWESISRNFVERSANECKLQWNCFLKSDINTKKFTQSEIAKLKEIAEKHNFTNWIKIAEEVGTNKHPATYLRYYKQNLSREHFKWSKKDNRLLLRAYKEKGNEGVKDMSRKLCRNFRSTQIHLKQLLEKPCPTIQGKWTKKEDILLLKGVLENGFSWEHISDFVGTRSIKQCSDRYKFHLNPQLKKNVSWSMEEEDQLIELAKEHMEKFGKLRWSSLAEAFPGRTSRNIMNKWYSIIKADKEID